MSKQTANPKSKNGYEEHLNTKFNDLDRADCREKFNYLTDKTRAKYLTEEALNAAIFSGNMGKMLRRYDSFIFEQGYEKWLNE